MQHSAVMAQLKTYIVEKVLDDRNIGLDETTPLLEWGVINSIEIVRLISFIQKQFNVSISPAEMVAEHFTDLRAITNLIIKTAEGQPVEQGGQ